MAYKYSVGRRDFGDIDYEGDDNTQIDFDADFIALVTNGVQMLTVSGSQVGIGTTDPDNTLHVKSPGTTHVKIESDEGSEAAVKLKSGDQNSVYLWAVGGTPDLRFYVNGADRMHLDGDGSVGIGTTAPGSGLHVNSSFATAITAKSQDYTLTAGDHTVLVDCSGGNVTITLPTAVGCPGRMYIVKRTDTSANSANIDANGSEQIEGSTSLVGVAARGSIVLQSDNSGWWKVAEYINPP
jgi:hypothetical protein